MIHFDRANLKVTETGEGFLKGVVTFAVPGVLPYVYGDSIRYEAKLPEEILSSKTIDSARGAPITDEHPIDENGNYIFVNTENYKSLVRGTISDPHVEAGEGKAHVTIYDKPLIERIKSKEQNEVSIGFSFDMDNKPGTFNGLRYDAIQRNIIVNHVAAVRDARAGDKTKIHIDRSNKMTTENSSGKEQYSYRTFDGKKDLTVESKEIFDEMLVLNKKIKADQDEIKELNDKLVTATREPDNSKEKDLIEKIQLLTDQNEELKKNYATLEASVPAMVEATATERIAVLDSARASGVEGKMDGLSNREIKLQLIAKHLPVKDGIKVDSMTDEAINSRYDAALELAKMKANHVDTSQSGRKDTRIDAATIQEKKNKMQNQFMYKVEGGK